MLPLGDVVISAYIPLDTLYTIINFGELLRMTLDDEYSLIVEGVEFDTGPLGIPFIDRVQNLRLTDHKNTTAPKMIRYLPISLIRLSTECLPVMLSVKTLRHSFIFFLLTGLLFCFAF